MKVACSINRQGTGRLTVTGDIAGLEAPGLFRLPTPPSDVASRGGCEACCMTASESWLMQIGGST